MLRAAADAGVKLHRVKAVGDFNGPLLASAVGGGHLECVRALLDCGCDVNERFPVEAAPAGARPWMASALDLMRAASHPGIL